MRSQTVSRGLTEAQQYKEGREIAAADEDEKLSTRDGFFFSSFFSQQTPGSGFVSGGRQEQGGGCSFQVWQGDRHVSVD